MNDVVSNSVVRTSNVSAHLSPMSRLEGALWQYLLHHLHRTISREELLRQVWGVNPAGLTTRTVDMHVAKLRKKLASPAAPPFRLKTVRGTGYRLAAR